MIVGLRLAVPPSLMKALEEVFDQFHQTKKCNKSKGMAAYGCEVNLNLHELNVPSTMPLHTFTFIIACADAHAAAEVALKIFQKHGVVAYGRSALVNEKVSGYCIVPAHMKEIELVFVADRCFL